MKENKILSNVETKEVVSEVTEVIPEVVSGTVETIEDILPTSSSKIGIGAGIAIGIGTCVAGYAIHKYVLPKVKNHIGKLRGQDDEFIEVETIELNDDAE